MSKYDSPAPALRRPASRHNVTGHQRLRSIATILTAAIALESSGSSDSPTRQAVPASVSVSPAELTLGTGKTGPLQATVTDADGASITGARVSWSTSSPVVATVAATGIVPASRPASHASPQQQDP